VHAEGALYTVENGGVDDEEGDAAGYDYSTETE
jgi:hypothetical protein